MANLKIVFFDVDGVLVPVRSSWGYLHRYFGVEEEAERAARDFIEGRIDYAEWMRRDTELWVKAAGGALHRSRLAEILSGIPLTPGARELVAWLHRAGIRVVLLSAGVEVLVARVAREVGADAWVSPRLWFDKRGFLVPGGSPYVTPGRGPRSKGALARRLAQLYGADLSETAFVGDSRWDRDAMEAVGHPIAYGDSCPELDGIAECRVLDMKGLREALADIMERGSCRAKIYPGGRG